MSLSEKQSRVYHNYSVDNILPHGDGESGSKYKNTWKTLTWLLLSVKNENCLFMWDLEKYNNYAAMIFPNSFKFLYS